MGSYPPGECKLVLEPTPNALTEKHRELGFGTL